MRDLLVVIGLRAVEITDLAVVIADLLIPGLKVDQDAEAPKVVVFPLPDTSALVDPEPSVMAQSSLKFDCKEELVTLLKYLFLCSEREQPIAYTRWRYRYPFIVNPDPPEKYEPQRKVPELAPIEPLRPVTSSVNFSPFTNKLMADPV